MAGQYGDSVSQSATQTQLSIVATEWRALQVGTAPLAGRRQVRIFVRGNAGHALALAYANRNEEGTFTTPTDSVRSVTVYPGGSYIYEPLGDGVAVFGRLLLKVGVTDSSVKVIITEYK